MGAIHQVWKVRVGMIVVRFVMMMDNCILSPPILKEDPINHKKYNIHLFKMTPDGKSLSRIR
jgi:hypothetical protein